MSNRVLEATVRNQGELVMVDLMGEISAAAEEALNKAYEQAMQSNPGTIVINFSGVDYINSTGIALILNLLVKAGRLRRRVFAYGLSDHYREIFRITRLADFIRIYQDEASVLASV